MPEKIITVTPGNGLDSLSYWQFLCFFSSCSFSYVFSCVLYPFCIVPSGSFPSSSGTSFHTSFFPFCFYLSAPSSAESLLMFFFSPLVILPLPIFLLLFLWSLAHARFLGHCSSPLFFPSRRCPSDKGNKSWKSLPKLQGQHFLFSGSFNFKREKKKITASSPSLRCAFAFWAASISWGTAR